MYTGDLRAKFRHARHLFMRGLFVEATESFSALDQAYPNNAEVLYALARCLMKLRRLDEATRIANRLQTMLRDDRGRLLRERIQVLRAREGQGGDETDWDD